jgi:SulP family sulfate permease
MKLVGCCRHRCSRRSNYYRPTLMTILSCWLLLVCTVGIQSTTTTTRPWMGAGVDAFSPNRVTSVLSRTIGRNPKSETTAAASAGVATTNSSSEDEKEDDKKVTLASQLESIVGNAKMLNPFGNNNSSNSNSNNKKRKSKTDGKVVWQSLAAGLAVSLAMVPEAISFAFVAGVNPLVGLWTTVILGLVAAAFGGRAGICSSASGACAVVVAALCQAHGPSYLSACAILAGLLQIVFGGFFGAGKFIRLVPHPVMLGFVNGLAVVMTRAQMVHFQDAAAATWLPLSSKVGQATYGITALTMILVRWFLPKFVPSIPPSLGAVTVATIITRLAKLPIKTLADAAGADTFAGGLSILPKLALPAVPWLSLETWNIVAPYAITMAAVGSIESLLTMQLIDGIMDDGKRGSTKKECMGQGLGNVASGLFGGIGGCALLGQSIINVQSGGGKSRLSGMSMALFLALGLVAFSPILASVPIASLVGVMLVVCQSTFSWSSLRILHKIPKLDAAVIALVSYITVKDDLAKAVVAGVSASALGFAWKQSTSIMATTSTIPRPFADIDAAQLESEETKWKQYKLFGPLFFGSTLQFQKLFPIKDDPTNIVLDFTNCRVMDHSALQTIEDISNRYHAAGKIVHIQHLSPDCAALLERLHTEESNNNNNNNNNNNPQNYKLLIESDPSTDPVYGLAEDYKDITITPTTK